MQKKTFILDLDVLPLTQSSVRKNIRFLRLLTISVISKSYRSIDLCSSPSVVLPPAGTPDEQQRYGWTISRIFIMLLYLLHGTCPTASECLLTSVYSVHFILFIQKHCNPKISFNTVPVFSVFFKLSV